MTIDTVKQAELGTKARVLIEEIEKKTIEREELARLITLAIFSKSHIFLIGLPGVGKTYVINIALRAVRDAKYFEYLVMAGTKQEELFGTSFINENGKLEYDIEGSVLDSHYVLLDEMFKGDSGILNSLLGVTSNERTFFMRGRGAIKVPLEVLFGASNEFPQDDALEPFDDRLLIRYDVERIKKPENYRRFIRGDFDRNPEVSVSLSLEDLRYAEMEAKLVRIPEEIVEIFTILKQAIVQDRIRISDRKMITAMNRIMKMSAYLNGRDHINYSDLFLLKHIAWREHTERRKIREVLDVKIYGSNREVQAALSELEDALSNQLRLLDGEVGDLLFKRMEIPQKGGEQIFMRLRQGFEGFKANIAAIEKGVRGLEEMYRFNTTIERQVEENFLLLSEPQTVFGHSEVVRLRDLGDLVTARHEMCEIFDEHCRDLYSYFQFIPSVHYRT